MPQEQTALITELEEPVGTCQLIRNMILMVCEIIFGCWHRNLSRPFTLSGWTYEVCLNCGKKFAYDGAEISSVVMRHVNLAQHKQFRRTRST